MPPPPEAGALPGCTLDLHFMTRHSSLICGEPLAAPTYFDLMAPPGVTVEDLSNYVLRGAREGFKHNLASDFTGFHYKPNYKSARDDAERISTAIRKRLAAGKTRGPFPWDQELPFGMDTLCVNPMGSVPYKHEPHRSRPIDDPAVNAVIDPPPFKMCTWDLVRTFSTPGCWYGLQDVESAFVCLPIHYDMWKYFAVAWSDVTVDHPSASSLRSTAQQFLYFHTHGLFGSRDMPFIFTMYMLFVTMVATALGIGLAPPYLDDIPHVYDRRSEVEWAMERYSALLTAMGSPEKASKRVPAFQKGDILGRGLNSRTFTMAVPSDKMERFMSRLRRCFSPGPKSGRVPCSELSSLIGEAAFLATVLPTVFSNVMAPIMDLARAGPSVGRLTKPGRANWTIKLTGAARYAGREMHQLFPYFNRTVSINTSLSHPWASPVYTDSSGGSDAGWGYASKHSFRAGSFTCAQKQACIAYLELLAVEYAVEEHATLWSGHRVPIYIDNTVVVSWATYGRVRSCSTHDGLRRRADAALRRVFGMALSYGFELRPIYIKSEENVMADALSRRDWRRFYNAYLVHDWGADVPIN